VNSTIGQLKAKPQVNHILLQKLRLEQNKVWTKLKMCIIFCVCKHYNNFRRRSCM